MPRAGELLEDRYELEAQIGEGGTAVVYRARDLVTKATVAIKVMDAGREQDPIALAFFRQEGRLAARIRDPHLVPALHFGVDADRHFIVYDYLPGTATLSVLAELGRIAPRRVCGIALQVLYALDTLHRADVVHGDVCLSNCLWREREGGRDEVRLCDLGCAWARSPVSNGPTMASDHRGTAFFTAPELMKAEAGDHRADLWSVGAMMYTLMTTQDVEVGAPEDPRLLVAKIPQAVSDVVMRALAPVDQRYPSALAMIEALRAVVSSPPAKRGVPLWASIAGMGLTAGLMTFVAAAHDDDADPVGRPPAELLAAGDTRVVALPAPAPPELGPPSGTAPTDAIPEAGLVPPPATAPTDAIPEAGLVPPPGTAPTDAIPEAGLVPPPATAPTDTTAKSAPVEPVLAADLKASPHPVRLTRAAVEKKVMEKAAALRACSSDDFISLGLRVVQGRATLETLDDNPALLPRDQCVVEVVSRLRFAKSDEAITSVVGVKLPDRP